jgi:hypothetical protein
MADLPGWPYYKIITITGQAGSGTDYQVELEIGDSAGGDFHLEGHCTNFPQDIRITDDDGTTLLDHFVEDITADPVVVQVEVKDDLGSNRDIRVYYGKSGETSASNIETTFLLGDDFPGSSIDTGKWDGNTADASVSGSILSFGSTYSTAFMLSKSQFGPNAALRTKYKFLNPTNFIDAYGFKSVGGAQSAINYYAYTPNNIIYVYNTAYNDLATDNVLNTWKTGDIKLIGGTSAAFFNDGVEQLNSPLTSQVPTETDLEVAIKGRANSAAVQMDWIVVRKYNSPEPAFSSAGAEQFPGLVPVFIRHNPALTGGMV